MISVSASAPHVALRVQHVSRNDFNAIIAFLKAGKARWNAEATAWHMPYTSFADIRSRLEDLDAVVVEDEAALAALDTVQEELSIETGRVIPDFSQLSYLPIVGKAPYENYQRQDIIAGISRNRYGYFLGMGSGKTYIMSALLAHYFFARRGVSRALIVTTSIGVRNLYHEIPHFVKGLTAADIMIADKSNRAPFYADNPARIVLMSYNTWRLVCKHYAKAKKITSTRPRKPFVPIEEWLNGDEGMLHLDESHSVAYHKSQQGHYMALHAPYFEYRYLYSGTPADKPEKLYNQLKILDPALVHNYSYTDWLDHYAHIGSRFSAYDINEWKHDKLEELNKRFTARYGVYRKSEEILELPPHYEKRIYLDMTGPHRHIYESFVMNTIVHDQEHGRVNTKEVVSRFPFMMLAIDNPKLLEKHIDRFDDTLVKRLDKFKPSMLRKYEALDEIIEEQDTAKGVIWITHPVTAQEIAERYASLNPLVVIGETPQEERNALIKRFQEDNKHQLLIANIVVLNTSVNITQATWQCYVERIWAYAPYEQSTKRIYRVGQTKAVTTYILIYQNSLDVLLDRNLASKGKLVDNLLARSFPTQREWKQIFNYNETDAADFEFEIPGESDIELI